MKLVAAGPLVAVLIIACGSATPADEAAAQPADLTLRYAAPRDPVDGALVIDRDASGRIRADVGGGQQVIIIRDGTSYMVWTPPGPGGQAVARVEDFLAVGGEMRAYLQRNGRMQSEPDRTAYRLADEGEATVAQWRGRRYALRPEESGVSLSAIISTDPALADAARVAATVFDTLDRIEGAVAIFPEQFVRMSGELRGRGMPIMWDRQELTAIGTGAAPASHFDLPAPALSREQLRARLLPR